MKIVIPDKKFTDEWIKRLAEKIRDVQRRETMPGIEIIEDKIIPEIENQAKSRGIEGADDGCNTGNSE